jgi:hypothetical protein
MQIGHDPKQEMVFDPIFLFEFPIAHLMDADVCHGH